MSSPLGTRIKDARLAAGLSREQLAGALGVSLSTVIRYETGESNSLSVVRLHEIARLTNQSVAFFLADEVAA